MASTTQTRISKTAHRKLTRIAQETGQTQQQVLDIAINRYERELFLTQTNEGYAALRSKEAAWREYVAEQDVLEGTLADGLD